MPGDKTEKVLVLNYGYHSDSRACHDITEICFFLIKMFLKVNEIL
jgi:hypothetical protein